MNLDSSDIVVTNGKNVLIFQSREAT